MTDSDSAPSPSPQNKHRKLRKAVKIVAIAFASLLLLIIAAVGVAVWVLTPERLTPMVNNLASEQLNAEVRASRVEIFFWSTFPRLTVEVDSLHIVSHSLHGAPADLRAKLPADADSLMSLAGFRGGVDVLSLLIGNISLYDVKLQSPRLNIVQADSVWANYNIVPPSEEKKEPKPLELPNISITRFSIVDGFPVRFTSIADSTSVEAVIAATNLEGSDAPTYTLTVSGKGGGTLGKLNIPAIPFGINGGVHWRAAEPGAVRLKDVDLSADKVAFQLNAAAQLLDTLAVNELKVVGRDIALADVLKLVPEQFGAELKKIETDLKASLSVELQQPYIPSTGHIPPVAVELTMPKGSLAYDRLQLHGVSANVKGLIDPDVPDRSVVELKKFTAAGRAIDFTLTALVHQPVSNPLVEGTFKGNVSFDNLPAALTSQLPATISGQLEGDADFKFHLSDLDIRNFHKLKANGKIKLHNFKARMRDGSASLATRNAEFRLGTSNSVTVNGSSVDSLLTASVTADTLTAGMPGISLGVRDLKMGFGAKNIASTIDTTQITPVGATISARRLTLRSDSDSMRVSLRDASIHASLSRYNNQARSMLLKLSTEMGSLRFADKLNRLSLRNVEADVTLHPKSRPAMSRRMQAAFDSVAARHPSLSSDSIMALTRRANARSHRSNGPQLQGKRENIDYGLDNSLKSWLRLWQAKANIKAKKARVFTPYFPLRTSLSNINLSIGTDSVTIRNTRAKLGHSDFTINGCISNISRALTSGRAPIDIDFSMRSDTININEITSALMRGSAFAERLQKGTAQMLDDEDDEVMDASIESQTSPDDRAAIVIPSNVNGRFSVKAGTMKYGDILFQRFTGDIEVYRGAVHLKKLGAFTPMGSFGMTALYSAPTAQDISFAGGVVIRRLDLHQFLHMLPEIDTIMPMLQSMEGIITAECAMTTRLDSMMNLKFNTLDMALKLSGDSLVLLDSETFRKVSKWLLFKNKKRNMIDSMNVEMRIRNSKLELYPFIVTLDRYRFGISGGNDMGLNLNYRIAVLKSPIPFRFGITIKGTAEHPRIGLGRAKFNEKEVASSRQLTDTMRINLVREIQRVFKFGVSNAKNTRLTLSEPKPSQGEFEVGDTISASDSLFFIRQGVITPPAGWVDPDTLKARQAAAAQQPTTKKKKKK